MNECFSSQICNAKKYSTLVAEETVFYLYFTAIILVLKS